MKKLSIFFFVFFCLRMGNAQISIGTTSINSSAGLELSFVDKGFLPPRLSTQERNQITNPVEGLTIYNYDINCLEFFNGVEWFNSCKDLPTHSVRTSTGKIWMDRNLGASTVASSSTDVNSYGYLYQWGRLSDGHQNRLSSTTSVLSSTDVPLSVDFIMSNTGLFDWRSSENPDLWQGVSGINNPCPAGYRLPTETEWNQERLSWNSSNSAGAFTSQLKLPMAGFRSAISGQLSNVGAIGRYWSSSAIFGISRSIVFDANSSNIVSQERGMGLSVRCIKE